MILLVILKPRWRYCAKRWNTMLKVQTSVCKKRSGWCSNFTKWNESDECGSQVKTKRESPNSWKNPCHRKALKQSFEVLVLLRISWCNVMYSGQKWGIREFVLPCILQNPYYVAARSLRSLRSNKLTKKNSCLCCHTAKIASCNRHCAGDWGCALIAFCFLSERDFQNKGSKMKNWRFQQTREPSSTTHASKLYKMQKIRTYYTINFIARHTTNHNYHMWNLVRSFE